MAKRISILGSTGSIGVNTLVVIDQLDEDLEVVYLLLIRMLKRLLSKQKSTDQKLWLLLITHPLSKLKMD